MNCLHCGAETTNGLALCDLCQRAAAVDLEFLPVYFRNLARWRRPARPNGSLGTSGTWLIRRGETEGSKIAVALEHAANDLDTWARALHDDRDVDLPSGDTDAETVVALCVLLAGSLTTIATLEWAGQFLADIARHERILRELTEAAVPGWYAGACQRRVSMEATCGADTFVVPGLTWVTCGECGTTTYARDHLPQILEEARAWVAPPKRLAEVVVALLDGEASIEDLRKRIAIWGERKHITTMRPHTYAPKKYRLGEVLDKLAG